MSISRIKFCSFRYQKFHTLEMTLQNQTHLCKKKCHVYCITNTPFMTASCRGEFKGSIRMVGLTKALLSIKILATSVWPAAQATQSGVAPSIVLAFIYFKRYAG